MVFSSLTFLLLFLPATLLVYAPIITENGTEQDLIKQETRGIYM